MKKILLAGLLMLAASFGGWYFASPGYALMSLHDAVKAGDAGAMDDHIDFVSVRESVKSSIKAKMADEVTGPDADPLAALGMAMADTLLDPIVDGMLTPEGMAAIIARGKDIDDAGDIPGNIGAAVDQNDNSIGDPPADSKSKTPNYEIKREGLSKFTVTFPDDPDAPDLIFKRDGLSWKLSDIDLTQIKLPGL